MKTRQDKINYLVENTTKLNLQQKMFWGEYLTRRLSLNILSHKELDEMIEFCDETNGDCILKLYLAD